MAGYTRQSLATIINGANITAPPLNAEFNQVSAAFNASSGHSHDGTTGNSPKINLTTSVAGYLPAEHGGIGGKNKLDATTTPTVTDDNNDGYAPGSLWENTTTGRIYICVGNSTGAAVWRELVQVNSGTAILPAATNTVDLGDNSNRFQDLFLSGGISASGNVAAGGTLNITGATALGSTLGVTGDTTLVNLSATGTTTITSIDLNSGAIDSTTIGTTTPAAGTFTTLNANTSLVAATADINGGSVDGATIGASTPSTGSFTTLGASGTSTLETVDINGGNIDGTAIGSAVQSTGAFTTVSTSGQATLATVDINGGSIDGAAIGANSTSSGVFTTLSASGGITGDIVGDVTGNSAGTHTGAVVGNVTGDLTGNVTAASGTSSFNNVTIDGTLNMNAGTSATIQNLTAPTNDLDAATKKYVDDEISTLIGDAGAGLNTLGELADALNDDDDFSTTVTNSIATKLPKAGGTMTGAIAMSTNKITGVGDPTSAQDVATKVYTDTQRDTRVAKSGDTMSGALAMGSNKITGLGTPTAGTDATTKTYVDGILGSSTAAATSASNAATSESNAATSETNASNSATAAAGSATSAAASLDSFDDRYLGAKSSAPTVDNDGDALIVGALYFDSTAGAMKVYSANGWTNAGSSVNGTTNRYSYTATAGQTVFAATYDAGYVDVFLNGVKQLVGTDVTATSGTSVVFASGTTVNDIVEIVGYGTFVLADHLTQTQSDARYVNLSGDTMTGTLTSERLNVTAATGLSSLAVTTNAFTIGSTNDYNMAFDPNEIQSRNNGAANDLILQKNGGSVGIGITPSKKLTVFGSGVGNATVQIEGESGADPYINFLANNAQHWSLGVDDSDSDKFKLSEHSALGTNDYFVVDVTGNVGIGVSTAIDAKLHVVGNTKLGSASSASWTDSLNDAGGLDIFVGSGSHALTVWDDNLQARPRFIVERGGNVGINTDTPVGALTVIQSGSGNDNGIRLVSNDDGSSTAPDLQLYKNSATPADSDNIGAIWFNGNDSTGAETTYATIYAVARDVSNGSEDGSLSFGTTNNGAFAVRSQIHQNGVYINPQGICLGTADYTTYVSNNTLDDYEEGNWTPSFTASTSNPTITYNPSERSASYIKIGKMVFVQGTIRTSSKTGGSGSLNLSGLPFTAQSASTPERPGGFSTSGYQTGFGTSHPTGGYINVGNDFFVVMDEGDGVSSTNLTPDDLGQSSFLMFHGQYRTD